MIKTMRRLDPVLNKLIEKEQMPDIMLQIERRQHLLHGIYKQIAIKFADLHDCPERLLAKNTIREIVPWKKSRSFFYWRLRYRLHLQKIYMQTKSISIKCLTKKVEDLIMNNTKEGLSDHYNATWCDKNPKPLKSLIKQIKQELLINKIVTLLKEFPEGFRSGIKFLQAKLKLN